MGKHASVVSFYDGNVGHSVLVQLQMQLLAGVEANWMMSRK